MFDRMQHRSSYWLGLAAMATLLALGLWLLGGQAAAAQDVPPPPRPAFERPASPIPRGPSIEPGPQTVQAPETGPLPLQGLPPIDPGLTLDLVSNALWGLVDPGDVVTATRTADGAYAAGESDGVGFFWSYFWLDNGQPADIAAGDSIDVYINGTWAVTLSPAAITGQVDVLADEVEGNVTGLASGTPVTVTLGDFGYVPATEPRVVTTTGVSGDFTADFGGVADIGPHMMAQVQYRDPTDGYTVQAYLYPSEVFRVSGWDAVEGYADPSSTVTVTVYVTYPTDIRWSEEVTASPPHGIYRAYASDYDEDIAYNDVVEVNLGGGTVISVTAVYLEMLADATTDEITGQAPPVATVHGRVWDNFAGFYADDTQVADGSGHFTLTLGVDLDTAQWPYTSYVDAEGDEVGYSAPPPHIRAYPIWPGFYAVADGPNQPVTYTLDTGTGLTTVSLWCGKTNTCDAAYVDSLEPGDVITAEFMGWEMDMTVADVSLEADPANDRITGNAPPGRLDVTVNQWNGLEYPAHGTAVTTTTVSSPFAVTFPGFDVRDGMQMFAYYYDADEGQRTFVWRGTWETPYFEVYPWGVGGVPPGPDEHIVVDLYAADGTTLLTSTDQDDDSDPWRFWYGNLGEYSIEPGNWVTVTADSGWTASLQVPTLTVQADADTDLIWGEAPKSSVFVEHNWPDGWDGRWVPVDGYVLDSSYFGGNVENGDWVHATYVHPNGNHVRSQYSPGELLRVELSLDVDGRTDMWGQAEAGTNVTVTTPLSTVYAYADPGCDGCWDLYAGELYPGDPVEVKAGAGEDPVDLTVPDPFTAQADSSLNRVTGQIGGWYDKMVEVHGSWEDGYQEVTTDPSGHFVANYGDVPRGGSGYIRFEDWYNYTQVIFHRNFVSPDLLLRVNYGHDWVEGTYEAGHTLWLTVTNELHEVQATIELQTMVVPWWGDQTGFSTNVEGATWVPQRPDIQEGWWVYGRLDNGYSSEVQVGTIEGTLDLVNSSIAGNIHATWLTDPLWVCCGVWEDNGPGECFEVNPVGGIYPYACDFASMDPGWTLVPGDDVGVQYDDPDGDQVINVFREPAPDMRVEKWPEGSGQVPAGGPAVFTLRYRNDGDAEATTIRLTDTLPADTTYVTDTSGVAHTSGPDWVAWTLGPLGPGEEKQFQIVLDNTADPGDTLVNVADVWTLYDDNSWNNHVEAQVDVVSSSQQPDLYVNKNPNPGDPAQGQTMLWEINYGNEQPVASGPVVLSDTLPDGTSVDSWFSGNGYSLWTESSTAGKFVLQAPTIPGNWGDRIYLRLQVDAIVGAQLTNTVAITTPNDSDPGNNWDQRNDAYVDNPRWNAHIDKSLGWGQLTPGGQVEYNLNVGNAGNMAADTTVTDSLPPGMSFNQAQNCTGPVCVPFPPDDVDDGTVVWNLGTMEPGEWLNLTLRLDIADDVDPGTILDNCAEVAIDGDDSWPYDDSDCVTETVNDYGPNLRIEKDYQWNGEIQLEYTIEFRNLGSMTLYDVDIVDTLPADTFFNNWWHWFWEDVQFDQDGDQLTWTISRLDPGWASGLRYQVNLDGDLIGEQGLCFDNAAEAPVPGDVWPADNEDAVTACTGPDVYAEKWLSGGEPRPGEVVTFTVEFGNHSLSPWDGDYEQGSHVTETLPSGMTFFTATAPWNPDERWHPEVVDGNTIVWGWGTMWSDNWWRFDVAARITGPVENGDVLVNTVEARGDNPGEMDPDEDNNVFELPVTILAPEFQVSKTYETTGLAGDVVTYTLTVTNVGDSTATKVVLKDELPAGLTYGGGDGTFDGTYVVWTFASLAPGGSATAQFWATLPDEAGTITNDTYRVTGSDQGITSASGPAVSFTVTAPGQPPAFQVTKTYETTGLTGDVVTYTLSVKNVGGVAATNVVLSDTLPVGLTYGGGGDAFDGTDVTWTIASIAPGATAKAWFWATLPDTEGTITNDAYRVVDCDQGVDSTSGSPVSFAVTTATYYLYLPTVVKNY
jgi:uncharacterized repeat protein (TIGR01451 family)